jgi:glutaryl-CoA dehydrogenase (non-decarboxylating)
VPVSQVRLEHVLEETSLGAARPDEARGLGEVVEGQAAALRRGDELGGRRRGARLPEVDHEALGRVQDAVLEVLDAMGRSRQPKDDGARALEDTRDNALVVYARRVCRDAGAGNSNPRPPVERCRVGRLDGVRVQRPACEVDDDPDERRVVPDPDLGCRQGRRSGCGYCPGDRGTAKEASRVRLMGTGKHATARGSRDIGGTRLIAVDFELTSEQREVQATVRQFVDERILPHAIENDINHHLDMGAIEGMAELGLLGVVIPEEYGGAGLDFVSEALVCEEIERGEAAFRTLISVHVGLNSLTLLRYGDEEQKQRYLVPQARGEKLACFGLTEPAAGSDVAAMLTNARREGDTYVLNGQKNWISYASVAEHALVFAKTDPEAKHRGISAFIVERDRPGVTTADTEHKLGIWAGSTGELFFENVEVPVENLLGEEGQGFEIAMYGLDQGRFTVAAGACGVIRACLEQSVAYARERETFGKPIGKNQFVQDMIAEMVLGYETSKLLVMQAAWLKDKGVRNTRETSLAKWHATESAFRAAHLAIQVHGAYGYSAEYGIERYFRNARAPIIYEGTTQIHKMMQAEHALGYRNLNGRDGDISPLASWGPALLAR